MQLLPDLEGTGLDDCAGDRADSLTSFNLALMLDKSPFLLLLSLLAAACAKQAPPAKPILTPGRYIGMDYMEEDIIPDDSTDRWYHENTLTVKADSLFLESVPVVFYKNQPKAYSSSDGGFYYYRGKLYRRGNQIVAKLLLTSQDYVATRYLIPQHMKSQATLNISLEEKIRRGIYVLDSRAFKKQFIVVASPTGFTMDNVVYSRTTRR